MSMFSLNLRCTGRVKPCPEDRWVSMELQLKERDLRFNGTHLLDPVQPQSVSQLGSCYLWDWEPPEI